MNEGLSDLRPGRQLGDGVYERLRGEILSCVLSPGSQVYEQELAQRYKVSKSPIRDALLRLQEQGLVRVLPRRGYRVEPVSLADAMDLYEMRLLYERAVAARVIDHATEPQLKELAAFGSEPAQKDLVGWITYNRRFHMALAQLCGNSRLARATIEVIQQFDRLTFVSVQHVGESGGLHRFVEEHREIIDAVRRRDKRQARALVRDHVESSRKRTLEAIADLVIVP